MSPVRTVLVAARPPEFEAWLERRHALDQARFDEVWEGEYHVAPHPIPNSWTDNGYLSR